MQTKDNNEIELDIVELLLAFWNKRKFILKITLGFCFFGVFISLLTRNEYKSEATILFESSSSPISGVSGLLKKYSGIAGINVNTDQEDEGTISPQIYPMIILSTPFLLNILKDTVEIGQKEILFYKYLEKHLSSSVWTIMWQYTLGLPQMLARSDLIDTLPQTPPFRLTKKQLRILDYLKEKIQISMDEQTGLTLTVSVLMPDPFVAEEITNKIINNLTTYLIEYKTDKAKQYLDFIDKKTEEAKMRFNVAQNNLAKFRDKNKNVISLEFKTEEENLQAEYNLTFDLYSTLAQQLEQAKLDVQKKKPIFKIISPAYVPTIKEKPHRVMIVIGFSFLGFFVGLLFIFLKISRQKIRMIFQGITRDSDKI